MRLSEVEKCGNRLDTSKDLNNKIIGLWGTKVGVGDWANMSAAFKALKERFPKSFLLAICGGYVERSYLKACPYIDLVLHESDIKSCEDREVDIGLNIQLDDNTLWKKPDGSDTTTMERQFTEMGLEPPLFIEPQFIIPEFNIKIAKDLIDQFSLVPGKFIIHHCGAVNPMLRWPKSHVEAFARLAMKEFRMSTVVIGFQNEWHMDAVYKNDEIINLTSSGWRTLSVLSNMALMELAEWFVGGHSGFNCIGGGLPIKMVSLYPYYQHWYMWSGRYRNSYNLIRKNSLSGGNLLRDHIPEKVFDVFKRVVNREIQLSIEEIFG